MGYLKKLIKLITDIHIIINCTDTAGQEGYDRVRLLAYPNVNATIY